MKLGNREGIEIWAKLGLTYSLNYKAASIPQSKWHRESNISVGFNIDRLNYLSVKTDFKWEIRVLMNLFLVLLGSNSIDLVWLKGSWFHIFANKKWCLLILKGFLKQCWLLNYSISKTICWYSIYKLIFYKCLMCTLTICFMKN